MLNRLARFLVLMAAVQILGGHWAALQSVAWVSMVIDYSKVSSLGSALKKTFDGEHPCSLCQSVSQGRKDEQKSDPVKSLVQLEAVLPASCLVPIPDARPNSYPSFKLLHAVIPLEPPTPPPLA